MPLLPFDQLRRVLHVVKLGEPRTNITSIEDTESFPAGFRSNDYIALNSEAPFFIMQLILFKFPGGIIVPHSPKSLLVANKCLFNNLSNMVFFDVLGMGEDDQLTDQANGEHLNTKDDHKRR